MEMDYSERNFLNLKRQKVVNLEMLFVYDRGAVKTLRKVKSSENEAIMSPKVFLLTRPSPSSKGNVNNKPCRGGGSEEK